MRVLLLAELYPPTIGGTELHVQALGRALVRRGHAVVVATMARPGAPAFEIDRGVRVHRLRGWSHRLARFYERPDYPFHPTVPDPGLVRALDLLVREVVPDVVHSHGWMLHSWLPLTDRHPAATVVTLHDYALSCATRNRFERDERVCTGPALAKCARCASSRYGPVKGVVTTLGLRAARPRYRRVDRFVANSAYVARNGSPTGRAPDDVAVIPSYLAESAPIPGPRPAFAPDGPYVAFAGALSAHKGFPVLVEAVRSGALDAPVVAMGTRRRDTPDLLPGRVHVVEDVPHADVMSAWDHAAVAVVPSVWPEPMGLVALEAMSCGVPVVASAVGGLGELVAGGAGVAVPPGDSRALGRAVTDLLRDPGRRAAIGAAGRVRAASLDAVDPLLGVYVDAIERRVGLRACSAAGARCSGTATP